MRQYRYRHAPTAPDEIAEAALIELSKLVRMAQELRQAFEADEQKEAATFFGPKP